MPGSKKDYFRLPDFKLMALVFVGLYLLVCSMYKPDWVPYDYLGPLGALTRYLANEQPQLMNILIAFTVITHVGEAIYAVYLCRSYGMSVSVQFQWFLSIICFGMFSLIHLWTYEQRQED